MRKFVYIFNFLGILLITTSLLSAFSLISFILETSDTYKTSEHRALYFYSGVISTLQQTVYPLTVAMICFFLAKLATLFGAPDVKAEIVSFIRSLRSAGKKHD